MARNRQLFARICSIFAAVLLLLSLTACGHTHKWEDATCTAPKTCADCGETQGEKLTHKSDSDGNCEFCRKDCTSVLLDGKRYDIPVTVYGGVKLGMIIRSPRDEALGFPCGYTIRDAQGDLVLEGAWSEQVLALPFSAEGYYCAYTQVLSLEPGAYTVTYQYSKNFRCTQSIKMQTTEFSHPGTAISAQYPMPITVK